MHEVWSLASIHRNYLTVGVTVDGGATDRLSFRPGRQFSLLPDDTRVDEWWQDARAPWTDVETGAGDWEMAGVGRRGEGEKGAGNGGGMRRR